MTKAAPAVFIALAVWFWSQPAGLAQQPQLLPGAGVAGELRNSPFTLAASATGDVRRLTPLVDGWLSDGTLRRRIAYDDSELIGRRHEALAQYYKGVPVWSADVMRQIDRGVTMSIFGTVYSGIDLDVSPRLTPEQAVEKLNDVSGSTRVTEAAPALTVLPTLNGGFALAYRAPMRDRSTYFVDANDGHLLLAFDNARYQSAVGSGQGVLGDTKKISTTQTAGGYRTRDTLRPATISTFDTRSSVASFMRLVYGGRWVDSDLAVDSDNTWTDPGVVDAHAHMGWVYDYYYKTHRYRGLDNGNSPMFAVLASRTAIPDNAFFIGAPYGPDGGGGMFFGESSSGSPMTALDVVAHELTHGVVNYAVLQRTGHEPTFALPLEAGATSVVVGGRSYSCATTTFNGYPFYCSNGRFVTVADHAGALNEGLADTFGTAVEFAYQPAGSGPQKGDYLMGEDLPRPGGFAAPIRSLENPASIVIDSTSGFRYPDHYSRHLGFALVLVGGYLDVSSLAIVGTNGALLPIDDDYGVHWNSTIISHAYYLAVEGGQNRTSGRTVQGVGAANRTQVEQVFFRAIRDLMPSAVTFPQMAAALRQAANDLYGSGGAPTRAVDQALTAVGL